MEKKLIEQLISNGLSTKKIKDIIDKLEDDEPIQDLNKTTVANTCGLRLIKCGSCNKKFYEDKFMLNRLNKRYRSCIDCVIRQRSYRRKKDIITNIDNIDNNNDNNNNNVLAILDTEYNEEHDNNDNDTNNTIYPFPYPIEKKEDVIITPSNDKPNNDI